MCVAVLQVKGIDLFVIVAMICLVLVFIINGVMEYKNNPDVWLKNAIFKTLLSMIMFVPAIVAWFSGPTIRPSQETLLVMSKVNKEISYFVDVQVEPPLFFLDKKTIIKKSSKRDLESMEWFFNQNNIVSLDDLNDKEKEILKSKNYYNKLDLTLDCYTYKGLRRIGDPEFSPNSDCLPFSVLWSDFLNGEYVIFLKSKKTRNAERKVVLRKELPYIFDYLGQKFAIIISRADLRGSIDKHYAEVLLFKVGM